MPDKRDPRECEAIRLLRDIVLGSVVEARAGMVTATRMLRSVRRPGSEKYACTKFSAKQLREMSRLRAESMPHAEIGRRLGTTAQMVHYHLKPSGAMYDALLEG